MFFIDPNLKGWWKISWFMLEGVSKSFFKKVDIIPHIASDIGSCYDIFHKLVKGHVFIHVLSYRTFLLIFFLFFFYSLINHKF